MSRKPAHEWILLFTYGFILVLIIMHSGFICQKLLFVGRQFMPIIVAGVLAFILNHPYKYAYILYEKKLQFNQRLARVFALVTVYFGLIGVGGALLRYALPRFVSGLQMFVERRELYIQAFENSMFLATEKLGINKIDLTPIIEGITGYIGRLDHLLEEILPRMALVTTGFFRTMATIGIILVLSAYMLYDKERLKRQGHRIYDVFIPEKYAKRGCRFLEMAHQVFDNFLIGQGLESLILGSLCFVGMLFLGLEYSGFISLIVGMTAFIPFLGAYIGGGLGTIFLLFISIKKAIVFLGFFVLLQQIENNFIYPRVVGKRTGLPSVLVLASVTVGGGLFGVIGMIFSVPIVTLLYIMLERAIDYREQQKKLDKQ